MTLARWSGGPSPHPADELVAIGKVLKPHGVRGELSVEVLTDFPERFEQTEEVHLVPPARGAAREAPSQVWVLPLESSRAHHGRMLVKLAGVSTVDQAGWLRNFLLAVPQDELVELEEGEYWHFELEGLQVFDRQGQRLGELREVLVTPAHDLYAVGTASGEIYIPAVDEYVHEVDLAAGRMVVTVPVIED